MTRSKNLLAAIAATALVAVGASATLSAKSRDGCGARPADASLTLYNAEALQGAPVTVTRDVANLQSVTAREGFDGTANDYAYSLRSVGQWQVCMDAGYQTDCFIVDGEVATLGERGGSISSVRYIGPSTGTTTVTATKPNGPASRPEESADWQPMYNVDLYGNDYRAIAYERPGSNWQSCKASCDADGACKAWTYVEPGRTPHGECFLKSPVPEASSSECCISGVKGAASAQGQRGAAAINLGLGRIGDTAKRAAEDEVNNAVDRKVRDALGRVLGN